MRTPKPTSAHPWKRGAFRQPLRKAIKSADNKQRAIDRYFNENVSLKDQIP